MTANLGVVQETMLIPLVIKANETLRQKARIRDEKAVEIMKQLQMDTETVSYTHLTLPTT